MWYNDELFIGIAPLKHVIMNFTAADKKHSPSIDINSKDLKNGSGRLIIDTGAELNFIKQKRVKANTPIDSRIKYDLFGINEEGVRTRGQVQIRINNSAIPFQIVSNSFPVESDGMLGMPFLSNSVINLQSKQIQNQLGTFSILDTKKSVDIKLKARTKQLITIPVKNPELKEGYLPLIPTGPGVYLGESLVSVANGRIKVYCINTTTCDVELTVPPVEIKEFKLGEPAPRTEKKAANSGNPISPHSDRFEKLVSELNLTNLNSEEKTQLLNTIEKFTYQFFISGDRLGCTNIVKHTINTINEEPVRKPNHTLPMIQREFVKGEEKALLEEGRIQESDSP